jgi:hypothetical protein
MPSAPHDAMVIAVRDRPTFPVELLRSRGLPVPEFDRAELISSDLSTPSAIEFRADAVVRYTRGDAMEFAVVYEVQISPDKGKRRSWPAYVANAYEQIGCPVILVVIATKPAVAKRCAVPIIVGEPAFVLTPMVFGPDRVPVLTDPEQARRNPQLAVLSALAHGDGPESVLVLDNLAAGLKSADPEHIDLYAGAVFATLSDAARTYLEAIMDDGKQRYHFPPFQRSYDRGEAAGEANAVLEILATRGLQVPDDVREQIVTCTDIDQLTAWVRRAVVARTVDDLFELPDAA